MVRRHPAHHRLARPELAAANRALRVRSPACGGWHSPSSVAGWPPADLDGAARVDDALTPNSGLGSPAFADRGIYELSPATPVDSPPLVQAPASVSVAESTTVIVNMTVSDPNGDPIASLGADLSGLPAGSDAVFAANATHTAGTLTWHTTRNDGRTAPYPVTFTAANALAGAATTQIQVIDVPDQAPVVSAPGSLRVSKNAAVTVNVTAKDPDGDAILSLTADSSTLGGDAAFTAAPDHRSGTLTWTASRTGNFTVTFRASNALTGTAQTALHVKNHAVLALSTPEEPDARPLSMPTLSQALPDPTRGDAEFELDLPRAARVEWAVFDLQGRALLDESRFAGAGRVPLRWSRDPRSAGEGVYFARVRVDRQAFVRRFHIVP